VAQGKPRGKEAKAGWTGWEIRAELLRRGITVADVARIAGVSRPCVSLVIHRHIPRYKGRRIRRIIAAILDRDVREIWPDEAA
jgi:lambda repressor-like predicted transcriptional regulator